MNTIKQYKQKRNIRLFGAGRLVSLMGSYMFQFAAGLYVLQLTGSGMQFAVTLMMGTVPRVLLAPIAGVLADRLPKKKIVVLTDMLSGMVILAMVLLSHEKGFSVTLIYIALFILTSLNTFFDVAIESAKPNLVFENQLEKFNALSYGIEHFTAVAGPVLGGMIFGLINFRYFILYNGISFILSGVSELFIDFRLNTRKHEDMSKRNLEGADEQSIIEDLNESITYLRANGFIRQLMLFSVSINFCLTFALIVPLPYYLSEVLKVDATWIGIINAGLPIGFLIGVLCIGKRPVTDKVKTFAITIMALWAIIVGIGIVQALPQNTSLMIRLWSLTGFMILSGLTVAFLDVPLMTTMQLAIPEDVRGRVLSFMMMASRLAMPFAMVLSGQGLSLFLPKVMAFTGCGLMLILIIWIYKKGVFEAYREFIDIQASEHVKILTDVQKERV